MLLFVSVPVCPDEGFLALILFILVLAHVLVLQAPQAVAGGTPPRKSGFLLAT